MSDDHGEDQMTAGTEHGSRWLWITHVPGPYNYAWDRQRWVYVQRHGEIVDRFEATPSLECVEAACVE